MAEIFRVLCGVAVCPALLAGRTRRAAERWRACAERVRDRIAGAAGVQPRDETGFRIGGQTQFPCWLSSPETGLGVRAGGTGALASGTLQEGGLRAPQAVLPEQDIGQDAELPHPGHLGRVGAQAAGPQALGKNPPGRVAAGGGEGGPGQNPAGAGPPAADAPLAAAEAAGVGAGGDAEQAGGGGGCGEAGREPLEAAVEGP